MSNDALLEQFKRDQHEALLSMDREKIMAFYAKYNDRQTLDRLNAMPELAFWGGIHKARTALTNLPMEARSASKRWLQDQGWQSWDDGDVPVAQEQGAVSERTIQVGG